MSESNVQAEVFAAIGSEPDLLLLRNSCGTVKYYEEKTGEPRFVTYGLGVGSPDLVGILIPRGRVFALEVKVPGEKPDPHQEKCHAIWRHFGAFVATVHSADEARAALARARGEVGPS